MIPLRDLRRIRHQLLRASNLLNAHYPVPLQDWEGSADDMETQRNLDTAFAHIEAWINFRENNRCDPYMVAAGRAALEQGHG